MIKILTKRVLIAAIAIITVPTALLAQKEKDKEKTKDSKEVQQITITRNGNKDEKTVIEIDGNKVKVNGKDASDDKNIHVHVMNMKRDNKLYRVNTDGNTFYHVSPDAFSYNFDNKDISLFSEDNNRAMLG